MNWWGLLGASGSSHILLVDLVGSRLWQPLKVVGLGLFMKSLFTLLDLFVHLNGFLGVPCQQLLLVLL